MATYTAITDAEIDQDSPITQTLMTKYRDNLTASMEGDPTAPKMVSKARDKTILYSAGTGDRDFSGLSIYGGVEFELTTTSSVYLYYSTNNGSSFTSWTGVFSTSSLVVLSSGSALATGYIDFSTGYAYCIESLGGYKSILSGATPPIAITDLRLNMTGAAILKPYGAIS